MAQKLCFTMLLLSQFLLRLPLGLFSPDRRLGGGGRSQRAARRRPAL